MKNILVVALGILVLASLGSFVGSSDFPLEFVDDSTSTISSFDESSISLQYEFIMPVVSNVDGKIKIEIGGLYNSFSENEPVLPYRIANVLIPMGYSVKDVKLYYKNENLIAQGEPVLGEKLVPMVPEGYFENIDLSESIYANYEEEVGVSEWTVQDIRGYSILSLVLNPVGYEDNKFYFYKNIDVFVELEYSGIVSEFFKNNDNSKREIYDLVDNDEVLETYFVMRPMSMRSFGAGEILPTSEQYDYVVITNENLRDSPDEYNFTTLISEKINRGISAKIVTIEEIYADSRFWCDGEYGDGCPDISSEFVVSFSISFNSSGSYSASNYLYNPGFFSFNFLGISKSTRTYTPSYNSPIIFNGTFNSFLQESEIGFVDEDYNISFSFDNASYSDISVGDYINFSEDGNYTLYFKFNYSKQGLFNDSAAKIRNYIKYAYNELGTQYVLLGGDISVIPYRTFYAPVDSYPMQIESDIYFSNLNGSFNANNDGLWGRSLDGLDLYAEVFVGRATVETYEELANFVRKSLLYNSALKNSSDYLDYLKSQFILYDPSTTNIAFLENFFNGSNMIIEKQIKTSVDNWMTSRINNVSSPISVINHIGHGGTVVLPGFWYGSQESQAISAFLNSLPFLFYSTSCDSGRFTWNTEWNNDSITEIFLTRRNGSFAVISNSRYGWYQPSTGSGPSQDVMHEFWYRVYAGNVSEIGRANTLAKESFNRNFDWLYGPYSLWVYYTQNLLGDPEQRLYVVGVSDDSTPPIINLYSPVVNFSDEPIKINYSINDTYFSSCSWRLINEDNGNFSFSKSASDCSQIYYESISLLSSGNYSFTIDASDRAGHASLNTTSFEFIDSVEPTVNYSGSDSDKKRFENVVFNLSAWDMFSVDSVTLETNISGEMLNYSIDNLIIGGASNFSIDGFSNSSLLSLNNTDGNFSWTLNLNTTAWDFAYRFYVYDLSNNSNLTDFVFVDVVNTLPVFNLSKRNGTSFFINTWQEINLSDLFYDIDNYELTFGVLENNSVYYSVNSTTGILNLTYLNVTSNASIVVYANDSFGITNKTLDVMVYGASWANWSSLFDPNVSTNLSSLTSFVNVPIILEKRQGGTFVGRINFSYVNITNISVDLNYISIFQDRVEVRSDFVPMFNVSADISLMTSRTNPVIYRNGEYCFSCSILNFNNSGHIWTLDFSVPGFSVYEIVDAFCGDGVCNYAESCSSCSIDCGSCSGGSSGGGSSGGGKNYNLGDGVKRVLEINEDNLKDLVLMTIDKDDKIIFGFKNKTHEIVFNSVDYSFVNLTIYSEPINFVLKNGQIMEIDLDNEGVLDLEIGYYNYSLGNVTLGIKIISKYQKNYIGGSGGVWESIKNVTNLDNANWGDYGFFIMIAIEIVLLTILFFIFLIFFGKKAHHHIKRKILERRSRVMTKNKKYFWDS